MNSSDKTQFQLSQLTPLISPLQTIGFKEALISGIACAPENAGPGCLYFCVNEFLRYGQWVEGANLLPEALARSPAALVTEIPVAGCTLPQFIVKNAIQSLARTAQHFFHDPDSRLAITGVTGTNGKTTTTHLIRHLLTRTGHSAACMGTIGVYGGAGKLFDAVYTTPLADALFGTLARIVDLGVTHLAMEVSSHALKLERVFGLRVKIAVFTNLTRDHLDFHQTPEDYRAAKQRLFHKLEQDGTAVINRDDPQGNVMAAAAQGRVIGYGIEQPAELRAVDIQYAPDATRFSLQYQGQTIPVKTRLVGRFNVYNALAAAATLLGYGVALPDLVAPFAEFDSTPGRMQIVKLPQHRVGIVDYAHTPDALENVLNAIRETVGGRIITVFGCGGDRDRGKRPLMGRLAEKLSDVCIVTSDNPRTEDPERIIQDILAGMAQTTAHIQPDRRQAIRLAYKLSREQDVILVAGKGHEDYQIIGVNKIHFSDMEELACLSQL